VCGGSGVGVGRCVGVWWVFVCVRCVCADHSFLRVRACACVHVIDS
jgi:hypothetical protein